MTSSHKMHTAVLNSPGACDRYAMYDMLSETSGFFHK